MTEGARETWITGVGIVSSLGEGHEAHLQALDAGRANVNSDAFAPYVVHPLAPIEFEKQISRKELRPMEAWQRTGVYAAGLALADAGLKGNDDLLSRTDLIVAAGGGERDLAVDGAILTGAPQAADKGAFLNQRLTGDLRPTLFLAQLSNLLAGNISIVHHVTGSSRTFMGEEAAGANAARIALARISAGQSDIALVGGAHNGERKDLLLIYECGGFALKGTHAPVWRRGTPGGLALASGGAFLVLEARGHAEARGARPLARLSAVLSEHTRRRPGDASAALTRMHERIEPRLRAGAHAIISGATGAQPATEEERAFLSARADVPVYASGTYIGHTMDAQFPMNLALAALTLKRGAMFGAPDAGIAGGALTGALAQVIVTGVGHWRSESLALVEAA
jgi:3-oxoacyl-[acyl-carrier-protein] synthase II